MPDTTIPGEPQLPPWLYADKEREREAFRHYLAGRLWRLEYSEEVARGTVLHEHLRHVQALWPRVDEEDPPSGGRLYYDAMYGPILGAVGFPIVPFSDLAVEDQENILLYFRSRAKQT